MKNKLTYLIYGFVALFLFACESPEEPLIPTAVILGVENFENGGVEITADFQNFTEENQVGYRISGDQFFYEESIITNPKIGRNNILLKNGLYQNQKYYLTAFIRTVVDKEKELVKYSSSKTTEFYALYGSYIPQVKTISPSVGYIGDLIEINFSEKLGGVKKEDFVIKLHIQDVKIVDIIDDQKIICRVPQFLSKHAYYRYPWAKMSITYLGKVVPCNYEFNIKAPKITSISPKVIDWNGEIIIKGDFYKEGYPIDFLTVNINERSVTDITKITPTEIRLNVSIHSVDNNPKILLSSNMRSVEETNTFSYFAPEILSYQRGVIGDEIEILGKYFWPASDLNVVYFDNNIAKITYGDANRLVVKIPYGTYINNKASLKIKITDELVSETKVYTFK